MNDLIWRRCSICGQLNLVPATLVPACPYGEGSGVSGTSATRCDRCISRALSFAAVARQPDRALTFQGQPTRSFFDLAPSAPSRHAQPGATAAVDDADRLLASVFPDGVDL
jgi:hypothetical protein